MTDTLPQTTQLDSISSIPCFDDDKSFLKCGVLDNYKSIACTNDKVPKIWSKVINDTIHNRVVFEYNFQTNYNDAVYFALQQDTNGSKLRVTLQPVREILKNSESSYFQIRSPVLRAFVCAQEQATRNFHTYQENQGVRNTDFTPLHQDLRSCIALLLQSITYAFIKVQNNVKNFGTLSGAITTENLLEVFDLSLHYIGLDNLLLEYLECGNIRLLDTYSRELLDIFTVMAQPENYISKDDKRDMNVLRLMYGCTAFPVM